MYLINGIVHTMASEVIPSGFVAFEGGKLTAVGAMEQLTLPTGAEVLDVAGCHIYPGLVDAHSHLGMFGTAWALRETTATRSPPRRPSLRRTSREASR